MTTETDNNDKTLRVVSNGEFSDYPSLPEILKRKQGGGTTVSNKDFSPVLDSPIPPLPKGKEPLLPLTEAEREALPNGGNVVPLPKNKSVTKHGAYKVKKASDYFVKEDSNPEIYKSAMDWRETELLDMLQTCRKADSITELDFIKTYVDSLPGIQTDDYGNRYLFIPSKDGKLSPVAFSCHTDSVHWHYGKQAITVDKGVIELAFTSKADCLGADCGTGVWLMRHMVLEKIPGLYIFHRDEESGAQGSSWIARNNRKLLDGIKAVIAFDRKGYDSIITCQMGQRTASNAFAKSFGDAMLAATSADIRPLELKADPSGAFTDSYSYESFISECTNISVGYFAQHTGEEKQDLDFATRLLNGLIAMDWDSLVFERDPKARTPRYSSRVQRDFYGQHSGWSRGWESDLDEWDTQSGTYKDSSFGAWSNRMDSKYPRNARGHAYGTFADGVKEGYNSPYDDYANRTDEDGPKGYEWEDLTQLCIDYPEIMASLLLAYGCDLKEAREAVFRETGEDTESDSEEDED